MAVKQLSDLVEATTVNDTDEFLVRQGGEDKRVRKDKIANLQTLSGLTEPSGLTHNTLANINPADGTSHNASDINFLSGGISRIGGRVNIGDATATNSVDPMLNINRVVDDSISGNGHCFSDSSSINRSGNMAYACYDARITVDGSNNYDHIAPFQNGVEYKTTGTVSVAYGYVDSIIVTDTQIGSRYGAKIFNPTKIGAATIGTNIGIRIDEQTAGTQNFAVFTDGATPSYFGGKLTAFAGLQTSGIITLDGTTDSRVDLSASSGLRFEANIGSSYGFSFMTSGYTAFIMTNAVGTSDIRMWGKLRVDGDATLNAKLSVSGNAAFNGKTPAAPATLPAAATDLATAITLVNSMRTLLINVGLAN